MKEGNEMKVTVAMPISKEQLDALGNTVPGWSFEKRLSARLKREDLLDSDIIVGTVPTQILHDLPNLKLLQLDFAGSDNYAALPLFHGEKAPVLANASGAFGVTIAEHMVGSVLFLLRGFGQYRDNMKEHKWSRDCVPGLISGSRCLVLGLGDIGSCFAQRMHALGSTVTAVRRVPDRCPSYVESVHGQEELDRLLPDADIIACCMPNTPQTRKIINAHTLSLMKPTAVLLNVGRGSAIDSDALAEALFRHRIAGAALDVTDPEPLPGEHPLWDAPNCLITPHVSGLSIQEDPQQKILGIIARNLLHFKEGRPVENEVDIQTGYRKRPLPKD